MSSVVDSIRAEFLRYQLLAERAIDQVPEPLLGAPGPGGGNSVATIAWHLAGNLRSRFTAFLTEDGEKPWRDRDAEFAPRIAPRAVLHAHWNAGWMALFAAVDALADHDLSRVITIRGQPFPVQDALLRSLAHASYHVGQLVYLSHEHVGAAWQYLSIPPGGSAAYNAAPSIETAAAHAAALHATHGNPADRGAC